MVVPFPAGGPADAIGRVVAEKMAGLLGQPVVIENRGGAGGMTGIGVVAKSEPDGYTVGVASSGTLAINVGLQEKMPYDPLKDLKLITLIATVPELLVVGEKVPAKTVAELVALAKSQPGKLNFASTGIGGLPHLAAEMLKLHAGINMVHVPYTGAAPAVNDLLGGHVQLMFADIPVLLGNVQGGKLKALAVGSAQRAPSLPDVPTTAEAGLPDVKADNWYGLVASGATPPAITAKLSTAVVAALKSDEVKAKLGPQGANLVGNTPEQFTAFVRAEIDKWRAVIKAAGIKPQP